MNTIKKAIESNNVAAVKSLLAMGSVDVNARVADMLKSPLLVLAADLGQVEIVALLLDAGAPVDDVNNRGESACLAAARREHIAVVELLVARNANLALRNRRDETPIEIAIDTKNERLVMLLIDAAIAAGMPLDDDTVCRAAAFSADVIRLLLFKHRINLSTIRDVVGCTPLHRAVWVASDVSAFDALIEVAGVDVDARGK